MAESDLYFDGPRQRLSIWRGIWVLALLLNACASEPALDKPTAASLGIEQQMPAAEKDFRICAICPVPSSKTFYQKREVMAVTVHFASGSRDLDTSAQEKLQTFAQRVSERLSANVPSTIEIIGYTDAEGDSKNNERLALQRAEAIRARLQSLFGKQRVDMNTRGRGDCCFIADNRTTTGRAANRRATITLYQSSKGEN